MSFSDAQIRKLKTNVRRDYIREREVDGKILHYLEGWRVIAEANRIFGFDSWDRETISSQCVAQRQTNQGCHAAYLTRIRITVRAGDALVVREGIGSGEAIAPSSGQAHERASKAAETDATKRALCTFGNPFGLSLYRGKQVTSGPSVPEPAVAEPVADDHDIAYLPVHLPPAGGVGARIEKHALALPEPKRIRNTDHLRLVAAQPCLICARQPSQAHHLRFAQPRAMGRKVSDEYTVPLCAIHHRQLHDHGNEREWWRTYSIEPLAIAERLWRESRQIEPAVTSA